MDTTEWKWHTNDGLEMYSKAWVPSQKARAVIILVHGVGEHISRYEADGEALAEAGYILAGFDQRGFGKSGGRRGHTPSLDAYFNDIDCFLDEIAGRYPGQPRFLYGNSMGAMLALAYTPIRQPAVAGVIATALALQSALEEQKLKIWLAKLLVKVLPTFTLKNGIDPQMLSRDPKVADEYTHDPLVHPYVTAGWGIAMLRTIAFNLENAHCFPLPLLLMHGTQDELNYPGSSQLFAERAPQDKVTLKMWDGFKHELHTDPEKAQVFKVMIDWLDAQCMREPGQGGGS
jgi:alpha-beta hydrolase superfamily lysophospholipase